MYLRKRTIVICCIMMGIALAACGFEGTPTGHTAAPSMPPTEQVNLVFNPGFEEPSQGSVPPGWVADAWQEGATFASDNTQAHSGQSSARISASEPNDARWVQTIPVVPNTQYILSGWVKTENIELVDGPVETGASLSLQNTWEHTTGVVGTTDDWTYQEMSFDSGENTEVTIACRLGYWAGIVTGTMWCDDIILRPKATAGSTQFTTPTMAFRDAVGAAGYPLITLEQVGDIPAGTRVRAGETWFDGSNTMYRITSEDGSTADAREDQLALASGAIPSPASTVHLDATPTAIPTSTLTPTPPAAHLRTLYGKFIAMAFSKDGKMLATLEESDEDSGLVRLWDTATGEIRHTLEDTIYLGPSWDQYATEYLRWSPDGSKLAAVSYQTVTLWDGMTGKHLQTIELDFPMEDIRSLQMVLGVAWSENRLLAVGASWPVTGLVVWEAETGQQLNIFKYPSATTTRFDGASGFAWSPYGAVLVAGDDINRFYLLNPVSGTLMRTFKSFFDRPLDNDVAFSPDGSKLISAARVGVAGRPERYEALIAPVSAWDVLTGEELYTLRGLSGEVSSVSFSPDGSMFATGAARGCFRFSFEDYFSCDVYGDIMLWDAGTGAYLNALIGLPSEVRDMAWSPAGDLIAARMGDGTIMFWSVQAILSATPPLMYTQPPTSTPALRPDGKIEITLYSRSSGNPDEYVGEKRIVEPAASLPETVLREFFKDLSAQKRDEYYIDFTDFSLFRLEDGIAYIHLVGQCPRTGSTWTITQVLSKNLLQFPEIRRVRYFIPAGDGVTDAFGTDCFAP